MAYSLSDFQGVLSGNSWTGTAGQGASINYYFTANTTSAERVAVRTVLQDIASFTNLTFVEHFGASPIGDTSADVNFTLNGLPTNLNTIAVADIYFGLDTLQNGYNKGSIGYQVIVHEILHGLGLKHGNWQEAGDHGPYLSGANDYNTLDFSVLSDIAGEHISGGNALATPGLLDVAALQYLYGANMATNTGNNTHTLGDNGINHVIWDAAGIDTMTVAASFTGNVTMVLDSWAPSILGQTYSWVAGGVVIENATGGAGNDIIYANNAANNLSGGKGNDNISGGGSNDTISGGDGNDTLNGDSGNDTISGGAGNDAIGTGTGTDTVSGNEGNDFIKAGYGNHSINGDAGDDNIEGNTGNMTIFGGEGHDSLNLYYGSYLAVGGNGNDFINASSLVSSTLNGGAGNDSFWILEGNNGVYGGAGNDYISVIEGQFTVHGGAGDDIINSIDGSDLLLGENGGDAIYISGGSGLASGGMGNDTITGGAMADWLHGNQGNDSILGNAGADSLYGGAGNDTMNGGLGADKLFIGVQAGDHDVIRAFQAVDVINLSAFGIANTAAFLASIVKVGTTHTITLSGTQNLVVMDYAGVLVADDFAF